MCKVLLSLLLHLVAMSAAIGSACLNRINRAEAVNTSVDSAGRSVEY